MKICPNSHEHESPGGEHEEQQVEDCSGEVEPQQVLHREEQGVEQSSWGDSRGGICRRSQHGGQVILIICNILLLICIVWLLIPSVQKQLEGA